MVLRSMRVCVGVGSGEKERERKLHPNILYMQISFTMGNKYLTLFFAGICGRKSTEKPSNPFKIQ